MLKIYKHFCLREGEIYKNLNKLKQSDAQSSIHTGLLWAASYQKIDNMLEHHNQKILNRR